MESGMREVGERRPPRSAIVDRRRGVNSAESHSRLDALATSVVVSYAERGGPFANGWECAQRIRAMTATA
jgi:hypothetical protein